MSTAHVEGDAGGEILAANKDFRFGAVEARPPDVRRPLSGPVHLAARHIEREQVRAGESMDKIGVPGAVHVDPLNVATPEIGPIELSAHRVQDTLCGSLSPRTRICWPVPTPEK